MLLEEIKKKEIVLLMGKLCSGKGYVCDNVYPDHKQITVSTIVKRLSGRSTRSELTKTSDLDMKIVDELVREIDTVNGSVIVDGIRQLTIVKGLRQHYGEANIQIDWMDVPSDIRKQRFDTRNADKDDVSFDDASAMDASLGIDDVEKWVHTNDNTHFRS